MTTQNYTEIFNTDTLKKLFPADRSDRFFDALYGDPSEGAYDISLKFEGLSQNKLHFEFQLTQRPGKCLACNLTYGLPDVLGRHPIINVKGVVQAIEQLLNGNEKCREWALGRTREISRKLHVVPLVITLESSV
jgi:hypothetical protein